MVRDGQGQLNEAGAEILQVSNSFNVYKDNPS